MKFHLTEQEKVQALQKCREVEEKMKQAAESIEELKHMLESRAMSISKTMRKEMSYYEIKISSTLFLLQVGEARDRKTPERIFDLN
jgi:hypothetical protein